ncbi:MAG: phage tail protein [Alteromonadaceae bacterium]|nr:MAG: phage tail protein [Alteromonadaceae bacterium]
MDNDLQTGFYFNVTIDSDSSDSAFQEVSGLSQEMGIEEVVSGGENRFKHRLPSTVRYPNLVLKRGILMANSPLITWCRDTLSGEFSKPVQTKTILINLLNSEGQSSMTWTIVNAYPIKWSVADLKSQESNVLIETIELAYQYFNVGDSRS